MPKCSTGNDDKGTHTQNYNLTTVRKKNLMKYEVYSYTSISVSYNIFMASDVRNSERKKLSRSSLIVIFLAVHGVIN